MNALQQTVMEILVIITENDVNTNSPVGSSPPHSYKELLNIDDEGQLLQCYIIVIRTLIIESRLQITDETVAYSFLADTLLIAVTLQEWYETMQELVSYLNITEVEDSASIFVDHIPNSHIVGIRYRH